MLKSLDIKNFTVFAHANLQFSPQLNVIVGENGTGKSHLLKLPYSIIAASAEERRRANGDSATKTAFQGRLADKLVAVLRPENLSRLARRLHGLTRCDVQCHFDSAKLDFAFGFSTKNKSEMTIKRLPAGWVEKPPVFLPARELLTIYPGFVSVYESHYLEFEETWRDTCLLLGAPALRGPREKVAQTLMKPLEAALGGTTELDKNGRFYLNIPGEGRMEMPLVAEGWRKLAMLARLIVTGSLLDKGYLLWDEPETNLNPRLIKAVARTILHLCRNGIQVFVATHSLFLLREIDILSKSDEWKGLKTRFLGLERSTDGVVVQQGETIDDIGAIAALDEDLGQSDRYLETADAQAR